MIKLYEEEAKEQWDDLILNKSANGNFLQTKRFLDYHSKDSFIDHSLMFYKDEKLAAVMPANISSDGKILLSHEGSTFGGLVISEAFCNTTGYKWIFDDLINHFKKLEIQTAELRMPNILYQRSDKKNELLEYFFQLNNFSIRMEVGFYIDLSGIDADYERHFDALRRRKLRKSYKAGLTFRKLNSKAEISDFYDVLCDNMKKFHKSPLHSLTEIYDFFNSRLKDEIEFFGVFLEDKMIAGSMVFNFCDKKVFHTQYLASCHEYLDNCPNEFLYTYLIRTAKNEGYRYLSFGTSTLERGRVYNENLGLYKEGFNTDSYVNKTFIWNKGEERI